jgi:WhiB family redox-sensing transcriptional regulator
MPAPESPALPHLRKTHVAGVSPESGPAATPSDETSALSRRPSDWQSRALCAQTDPEAFYPEQGGSTRAAKKICLGCEVRAECLEYALVHDERFGVWGGLSDPERQHLKQGTA